jgi:hypothetical protein
MNISDIAQQLQTALVDAQKAHKALEDAKAGLAPLEQAAANADDAVNDLMRQYQAETNVIPAMKRGARFIKEHRQKKAYNITPGSKIAATGKRAHTRAINAGKSEAEAKKAQKEAEKLLAEKLGVKK